MGPRRFNGEKSTWSWAFFLDLSDVRGISCELMLWFLPSFHHDKCLILWLVIFP